MLLNCLPGEHAQLEDEAADAGRAGLLVAVLGDAVEQVDPRVGDAVVGGEGDEQAVGQVVGEGQQVTHVPVGAEAAERLAGVLHQEVGREEAPEDANVGLEDLSINSIFGFSIGLCLEIQISFCYMSNPCKPQLF